MNSFADDKESNYPKGLFGSDTDDSDSTIDLVISAKITIAKRKNKNSNRINVSDTKRNNNKKTQQSTLSRRTSPFRRRRNIDITYAVTKKGSVHDE